MLCQAELQPLEELGVYQTSVFADIPENSSLGASAHKSLARLASGDPEAMLALTDGQGADVVSAAITLGDRPPFEVILTSFERAAMEADSGTGLA